VASNTRDLGPLADFEDGAMRRVELDGRGLVVVRKGEELFALRDICPHQGARLSNGWMGGSRWRASLATRSVTVRGARF
jgi:nitrite reductase/ring-hydroxylating ferredoxin subunit